MCDDCFAGVDFSKIKLEDIPPEQRLTNKLWFFKEMMNGSIQRSNTVTHGKEGVYSK